MITNKFFKFLSSYPVIFLFLYFFPFLGVCLIFLKFFTCKNSDRKKIPVVIIVIGIVVLIPKLVYLILDLIKFDINNIPYFMNIINSDLYNISLIKYAKLLLAIGIISYMLIVILKNIFDKISNYIYQYINKTAKETAKMQERNDYKMRQKQIDAKNTSYVECPNCGSDNFISDSVGKCKYCRSVLENKKYKGIN